MAAESASGIPLELVALVTSLPADGGGVPGEIVQHEAHAVGHAAVLLANRGVLLAGDRLSDVLVPMLDRRRPGQLDAYGKALERLDEAARHVGVLIPGHGAIAQGPEVAARFAADRAYLDALRQGEEPVDARWGPRLRGEQVWGTVGTLKPILSTLIGLMDSRSCALASACRTRSTAASEWTRRCWSTASPW